MLANILVRFELFCLFWGKGKEKNIDHHICLVFSHVSFCFTFEAL